MPSFVAANLPRQDMQDILALLGQLTDVVEFTSADIYRILRSWNLHVCVARDSGNMRIVGMACVKIDYTPMFTRNFTTAYIGDVVVDRHHRGKGLGEQLMRKVINKAFDEGAAYVSLTSNSHNPRRQPAIRLYERLGFQKIGELHGSNYYQLTARAWRENNPRG